MSDPIVRTEEPLVSGEAFKAMLSGLNPAAKLETLTEELKKATSVSKKDILIKQIKYLRGLQKTGLKPKDAYIINYMPVLPPNMRPATIMGGNQIKFADVNNLYKDHMTINGPLKNNIDELVPEELVKERADAYNGIKAIMGLGEAISPNSKGRGTKGLLAQISGSTGPKTGFFQSKILSKKQDFSGRATISANPDLGFNEAGIPIDMLWTSYKFHILRDLAKQGLDYVASEKAWTTRSPIAQMSFNKVIKAVPMILNRAPTLAKSNIIAVNPVPIEGHTIGVNPLHLPYFAGDFDGDAFSVFVPMTHDAINEAKTKLLASTQLHDYRKGVNNSMVAPGHEAILGSVYLTKAKEGETKQFKTEDDVLKALKAGTIDINTPVEITG